jgi:hypothetical protein
MQNKKLEQLVDFKREALRKWGLDSLTVQKPRLANHDVLVAGENITGT